MFFSVRETCLSFEEGVRMLVLSRKENQRIQIGDDIVLTVVQVKGGIVRLGIEAPAEVPVLRTELIQSQSAGEKPQRTRRVG